MPAGDPAGGGRAGRRYRSTDSRGLKILRWPRLTSSIQFGSECCDRKHASPRPDDPVGSWWWAVSRRAKFDADQTRLAVDGPCGDRSRPTTIGLTAHCDRVFDDYSLAAFVDTMGARRARQAVQTDSWRRKSPRRTLVLWSAARQSPGNAPVDNRPARRRDAYFAKMQRAGFAPISRCGDELAMRCCRLALIPNRLCPRRHSR